MTAYERLREACGVIRDLEHTAALLDWDQQTFMPVNAEPDRVAQLTTLAGVIHEKQTDPGFARLLEQAEAECRDCALPLRYFCLENPMDRRVHGVVKSQTRRSD